MSGNHFTAKFANDSGEITENMIRQTSVAW